jgi:hypothetical protein
MKEIKSKMKLALAAQGISMSSWARRQKITPQALHRIINGQSRSATIEKKISRFIDSQMKRIHSLHQGGAFGPSEGSDDAGSDSRTRENFPSGAKKVA